MVRCCALAVGVGCTVNPVTGQSQLDLMGEARPAYNHPDQALGAV